jgi:ankyrin repeat protein
VTPTQNSFEQLHRRVKRSDLMAIRKALDDGLDPNSANRFGWTLLMLAAANGTRSIGQLLISAGADVTSNQAEAQRAGLKLFH